MDTISKQIETMLLENASRGPGVLKGYEGGLSAAAGQDQTAINDLRGIYSDPSKFERSKMGAFGLGLMKGTKSGSFNEGMYNALAAATDVKDYNQEMNLSREEKLAKLSALQATLTRQTARDGVDVLNARGKYAQGLEGDRKTLADISLGGQPQGPRELYDGEQGPQAPGAMNEFDSARKTYHDYLSNPQKYSGAEGQAMVARAMKLLEQDRINARYEQVAATKAGAKGGKSLSAPEDRRVQKRIAELNEAAEVGRGMKNDLAILRSSRDKTKSEGGLGADLQATVGGWFGTENASNMQTVRSNAEHVRLAMTEKTKGAISDSEMKIFGVATPGLSMTDEAAGPVMDGQDAIADRLIERSKFMQKWVRTNNGSDYGADDAWDSFINENPIIVDDGKGGFTVNKGNVGNWDKYVYDDTGDAGGAASGSGGSFELDAEELQWAQEQLDGGVSKEEIMQEIMRNRGEGGQ